MALRWSAKQFCKRWREQQDVQSWMHTCPDVVGRVVRISSKSVIFDKGTAEISEISEDPLPLRRQLEQPADATNLMLLVTRENMAVHSTVPFDVHELCDALESVWEPPNGISKAQWHQIIQERTVVNNLVLRPTNTLVAKAPSSLHRSHTFVDAVSRAVDCILLNVLAPLDAHMNDLWEAVQNRTARTAQRRTLGQYVMCVDVVSEVLLCVAAVATSVLALHAFHEEAVLADPTYAHWMKAACSFEESASSASKLTESGRSRLLLVPTLLEVVADWKSLVTK